MNVSRQSPALLLLVAALSACHHTDSNASSDPTSMMLQLTWNPTDDPRDVPSEVVTTLAGQTVQVLPFLDQRPSPAQVGRNIQEHTVKPVTTSDNVAQFVSGRVSDIFRDVGARIVDSGAFRVIRGEVVQYFVTEEGTYKAEVILHITLTDSTGATLWDGTVAGHANRWGRSFSEQNYEEALSNSTVEAVHLLMNRPAFLAAFVGKAMAAPVMGVPPPMPAAAPPPPTTP